MFLRRPALPSLLFLALATACADGGGGGFVDPTPVPTPTPDLRPTPAPPRERGVRLELRVRDLWARPLATASGQLAGPAEPVEIPVGTTEQVVALTAVGFYTLELSAPDHEPLRLRLRYGGGLARDAVSLMREPGEDFGATLHHRIDENDARADTVHTLEVGLRHRWFAASGAPPRAGNRVSLLYSGEEAFASMSEDLLEARERIHIATWWWESDFELLRPPGHHLMSAEARRPNTAMAMLDASPALKRVLISELWDEHGIIERLNRDGTLDARQRVGGDAFEVLGEANETSGTFWVEIPPFRFGDRLRARSPELEAVRFDPEPELASRVEGRLVDMTAVPTGLDLQLASWHQKFAIFDGRITHVGGLNIKGVDWDSRRHLRFDERRMKFESDEDDRQAVRDHDSDTDYVPRRDYALRIEGPLARDVDALFRARWDRLIERRSEFAAAASHFELLDAPAPIEGGVVAQITATQPEPFADYGALESHIAAVRQAEDYIFIEDQYFRAPALFDAVEARMAERPALRLIVVTNPVLNLDPACGPTARAHARFARRFGARYLTLQLITFDTGESFGFDETDAWFEPVFIHSKLLAVDGRFLNVGSCNKNNRGFLYEGELNVSVLDDAFVREALRGVLADYLYADLDAVELSDGPALLDMLELRAAQNQEVWERWEAEGFDVDLDGAPLPAELQPDGLLYPLEPQPESDCFFPNVGPDVF